MCKFNENEIKEYLVKEDIQVLDTIGKKKNCSFSFRVAGADTIKCLSRGAGAKPHSILAKTIKNSGDQKTQNAVDNFFTDFNEKEKAEDLLKGLVGHWGEGASYIDGIFLTRLGKKIFEEENLKEEKKNNMKYKVISERTNFYLELKNSTDKKALIDFYDKLPASNQHIRNYLFTRLFFSGDYDMHDFWQIKAIVVSKVDMKIIEEMQKDLYFARQKQILKLCCPMLADAIDKCTAQNISEFIEEKFKVLNEEKGYEKDYYRVQHGPQYNYIAQMVNDNITCKSIEEYNYLVDKVANPDTPVLMYFEKEKQWKNILSVGELKEEYNKHHVALKETWADPEFIKKHKLFIAKQTLRLYKSQYAVERKQMENVLDPDSPIDSVREKKEQSYKELVAIRNKFEKMYPQVNEYKQHIKMALDEIFAQYK